MSDKSDKVINIKDIQAKEQVSIGQIGFVYANDLFDSEFNSDPYAMGYRQAYRGLKKENPFADGSDYSHKYNEGYAACKAEQKPEQKVKKSA